MEPTVSVVIPAWRAAATIGRAITSVLAQTIPVREILVIDDGSPDDLAAAIAPFGSRVRLIRQANAGAAAARNTGIAAATGEFIGFLDADDEWLPERLALQFRVLQQHPDLGFVAGRYRTVATPESAPEEVGPGPSWRDRVLQLDPDDAWRLAMGLWTGTVLVRRELLRTERFRTDLRTAEDRDLWIRILRSTPSWVTTEPLAIQHVTPGSLSLSDTDDDCRNMLRLIDLHADGTRRSVVRSREVALYRRWAGVLLATGRPRDARTPAWERLRRDPMSPEAWLIMLRTLLP